jgi:Family of unknown function (DUF6790)
MREWEGEKMFLKMLDWIRIIGVAVAFFFGYQIGFKDGYDPMVQLHFMIPIIIVAIAGMSGLEGIFFGKKSAELKGFETGSNYQKQSAIALLSYAVIALLVYFANWGIKAELTILFTFIFFFFFSAINHGMEAVKKKNYKWQNINRPFITLLLIAGLIYPVIKAIQGL